MHFLRVQTLERVSDIEGYYSWGLFSSGFEKRSSHVAAAIDQRVLRGRVALGFAEGKDLLSRPDNDRIFNETLNIPVVNPDATGYEAFLLTELDKLLTAGSNEKVSILIDYSVMTRAWYGLILNWARFANHNQPIEFDFVYAYGKYLSEFDPLSISDIIALPGYEGISAGLRNTVAVFGLGFDKYATLAVYDRLEPDSVICCVAENPDNDTSASKAIQENDVLCDVAGRVIRLPLGDLESAFAILSDNIASQELTSHIVVVPMGPKPHVLVSLLIALRLPRVTCLHAQGTRERPVQVEAEGPISVARVTFVPK